MKDMTPCPFCGSKEGLLVESDEYSWCMNPKCALYDYPIRINEWNSRAEFQELTTIREQVKVLREALGEARAAANHIHTACIDPNRPRQSIGEIAHHLVTTLDVLSQTKPKEVSDGQ